MSELDTEVGSATLTSQRHADRAYVRGLTRRWSLPAEAGATATGETPAESLMARVLHSRGLRHAEQFKKFCEPKLTDLHDPGSMPGIDAGAARIIDAIRRNELIAIYGDYDVDGIAAAAILYHTIKAIQPAARVRTYVPHRLEEGYGLNCDALRQLRAEGTDLVVSVDCGITAVRSAATAREIGLDLIITDHHGLPHDREALPDALALIHPAVPGSRYPFTDLCGAGVAFKLAWRLATMWCNSQRVSESLQKMLIDMLPLAALATIADVVPLTGENRILAAFGLRMIKRTPIVGLRALIEASNLLDASIDSEKVGFVLGPRLNACGRMGHAADALRLLTEASADEAADIAQRLTELNQHRQTVERRIVDQASRLAEDRGMTADDRRAVVLAHESWHAGVVGIACSRLVDRFTRPSVLLQRQGDVCKGSARSIDGYSIYDGLAATAPYLTTFGGHSMAAGLALPAERFEAFAEALIAHANASISSDQLTPTIVIDCDATLPELDVPSVRGLNALSPFGRGNRAPTLRIENVVLSAPPKQMGSHGKHLSMSFRQEHAHGRRFIRGVWWHAGERAADLASGMRLDLAIEPKLNEWNGQVSVEAEVRDLRVVEGTRDRAE